MSQPHVTTTPTLYTSADVARRIGVSADRVRALARESRIPIAAITPTGQRLFSESAVAALEASRRQAPAEHAG